MTDYGQFEFDMDDLTRHAFGGLPPPTSNDKIIIGVCAMPKKANSKPMREILGRLDPDGFSVTMFDIKTLREKPVAEWPLCHCLIAFFSDEFPLEMVEEYAALRKPFLVNELKPQHLLKDRRHVLELMDKFGVPTPDHVVVNRSTTSPSGFPVPMGREEDMEEFDDYIVVNGKRMDKPFVEKPVDGDDHNVYIYYPRTAGGGSCRLFRKVKDRSSEFFPSENNVRRKGSYIYETFLRTEGSDVKVYTVTSDYAHSEARKSPTIDGVVSRNEKGYEIRYPILLTSTEKEIAHRIIMATGQRICGFDVLRSDSMSYVCDVNGWSFVKNNLKYYDDFALILGDLLRRAMGFTSVKEFWPVNACSHDDSETENDSDVEVALRPGERNRLLASSALPLTGAAAKAAAAAAAKDQAVPHEELRCVIAVVRHGDRTPKQKLKITVQHARVLALFDKYGDRTSHEELKLKSAAELGDVLKIVVDLIEATETRRGADLDDSDCEDRDIYDMLLQARSVLEMHGTFKGINRKVQLKPTAWEDASGRIVEAQFILKWGGVLTYSGRQQAELMGQSFRQKLYPFDGLLRLHSTYRHDLKVYSSNEGRVQVTAAAFAKGMLQLEGHLTPILASLVRKSNDVDDLLDDASDAKRPIESIKQRLHNAIAEREPTEQGLLNEVAQTDAKSVIAALEHLHFAPRDAMKKLHTHITALVQQLRLCVKTQRARFGINLGRAGVANTGKLLEPETPRRTGSPSGESSSSAGASADTTEGGSAAASLDRVESDRNLQSILTEDTGTALLMSLYRWSKLEKDFFQKKKDKYDLSKIPDIHDSVKFDLLHNPQLLNLQPPHLLVIFKISSALADVIVPQEYGITPSEKKSVGSRIGKALLTKIQADLANTVNYCTRGEKRQVLRREQSVSGLPALGPRSATTGSLAIASPPPPNALSPSSAEGSGADATPSESRDNASDAGAGVDSRTVNGDEGESDSNETFHRLDKRHARSLGIKSSDRMVRTRLYFTSESHLHSLLNVLRFAAAKTVDAHPDEIEVDVPAIDAIAAEQLGGVPELDYLTHIVFRLFEIIPPKGQPRASPGDPPEAGPFPKRFRISVGISPGVRIAVDKDNKVQQGELEAMVHQPSPTDSHATQALGVGASSASTQAASVIAAEPEGSAYGSTAEIKLLPCSRLIPLWKDLEFNRLDALFTKVIRDVELELALERGAEMPPTSPKSAHSVSFAMSALDLNSRSRPAFGRDVSGI